MSERLDTGEHQMFVSVEMVVSIDPDRVEEWILANTDPENESVMVTDLTNGDGISAPVVADKGPHPEDLMAKGARQNDG